jgi:hypothetical protein
MRSKDDCGSVGREALVTLLFEAFAIDVLRASQSIQSAAVLLGIDGQPLRSS